MNVIVLNVINKNILKCRESDHERQQKYLLRPNPNIKFFFS